MGAKIVATPRPRESRQGVGSSSAHIRLVMGRALQTHEVLVFLLRRHCIADLVVIVLIGPNGRPRRREATQSISFDETSRIKSVRGRRHNFTYQN